MKIQDALIYIYIHINLSDMKQRAKNLLLQQQNVSPQATSYMIITTTGSLSDASLQTRAQKCEACDKSEWTIVSRQEWAGLYIWPRETEL